MGITGLGKLTLEEDHDSIQIECPMVNLLDLYIVSGCNVATYIVA